MKKLILLALAIPAIVFAQSYPAPTFNSIILQNPLTPANGGTGATSSTGTGSVVLSNSPTLVTPNLGTPSAITLTNGTGLPVAGLAGLGTGVATALGNAVTGSGSPVLAISPTINTPTISGGTINNAPISGSTGSFTTLAASSTVSGAGFTSLLAPYAPLASPAFTATPTAPTAAVGTNTTQLSTTAFVAQHAPCPSIMDNGGNNGGSVDNSAAFAATAALGPSGQACVYFPPGTYAFSSQLVYALAAGGSITIEGASVDNTKLLWAAGGGMQINYGSSRSSAHIRELSIVGGTTTGTGLSLSNSGTSGNAQAQLSTIDNVSVYGSGYISTDYWATGIQINNVSNVNLKGVSVVGANATYQANGVGLSLVGASVSSQAVQINIVASNFSYVGTGIHYGSFVQGVTVVSTNFTGNYIGINAPTPLNGQSGLSVTMSQFNCLVYGIYDGIGITGFFVDGNYFELPYNSGTTVVGIQVVQVYGHIISNNFFERVGSTATGLVGVAITGPSTIAGNISGNVFFALGTGIWLQSTSTSMVVQDNTYSSNATNLLDQGTGNFAAFQQGNPGYEFSANGNLHEWGEGVVTTDASGNFTIPLPETCPTAFDRAIVNNGDGTNNLINPFAVSESSTTSTLAGRVANIATATAVRVAWDVMCH